MAWRVTKKKQPGIKQPIAILIAFYRNSIVHTILKCDKAFRIFNLELLPLLKGIICYLPAAYQVPGYYLLYKKTVAKYLGNRLN